MLILTLSFVANSQVEVMRFEEDLESKTQSLVEVLSTVNNKNTNINPDDLIHYGDLIDVDVLGSTEYDWRGTITPEGFLNGIEFTDDEIYGLCRTGQQVAADVAKSYSKFLNSPLIDVTILDRSKRPVSTLFGAVNLPQRFKIKREVFLNELLVLSGGFTEKASGEIQILRQEDTSCVAKIEAENKKKVAKAKQQEEFIKVSQDNGSRFINIKISDLLSGIKEANPQILYGDIVTVLVAEPVYIIGGVINPIKLSVREKMTASRAISSAGGLTKTADSENITIFRREFGRTSVIKINLGEIEAGDAEDTVLKAYDIIDVSEKGRDIKKYPPIINFEDLENKSKLELPLRIID